MRRNSGSVRTSLRGEGGEARTGEPSLSCLAYNVCCNATSSIRFEAEISGYFQLLWGGLRKGGGRRTRVDQKICTLHIKSHIFRKYYFDILLRFELGKRIFLVWLAAINKVEGQGQTSQCCRAAAAASAGLSSLCSRDSELSSLP